MSLGYPLTLSAIRGHFPRYFQLHEFPDVDGRSLLGITPLSRSQLGSWEWSLTLSHFVMDLPMEIHRHEEPPPGLSHHLDLVHTTAAADPRWLDLLDARPLLNRYGLQYPFRTDGSLNWSTPVRVSHAGIYPKGLLQLLADLPRPAIYAESLHQTTLHFRFSGGTGQITPVRPPGLIGSKFAILQPPIDRMTRRPDWHWRDAPRTRGLPGEKTAAQLADELNPDPEKNTIIYD